MKQLLQSVVSENLQTQGEGMSRIIYTILSAEEQVEQDSRARSTTAVETQGDCWLRLNTVPILLFPAC